METPRHPSPGEPLGDLGTEKINDRSRHLDRLSTIDLVRLMNSEDEAVVRAVAEVSPKIASAIEQIADRLRRDGRLHYFGAGTSGRMGVIDASECPPTFGIAPTVVNGHMAGGDRAVFRAVEGAEDDRELGVKDVDLADVGHEDAVVAISASGRTPYALGVLDSARKRGALTVAIVCNRPTAMHGLADVVIDPVTGEEVLSGSTRLKAGTAQKLVLNAISTGVMVRLGRTYGNLMVGVVASNEKLRDRARRLVATITGRPDLAEGTLETTVWDVKKACVMIKKQVDLARAEDLLDKAGGVLARVLDD